MTIRTKIADPHHHLWDLGGTIHYPWLMGQPLSDFVSSHPDLIKNYVLPEYRADAKEFDLVKSVHVEVMPSDPVAETAWLQEQADTPGSDGFPHGIVASADLMADDFTDIVEAHSRHANFRGVRQILSWVTEPYMRDDKWRENFKRLGDLGLSFDMQINPEQMQDAAQLASDFPDVQVLLNHTGMPDMTDDQSVEQWRLGIPLLASCKNIAVKISGFFDSAWTKQNMRPFVLETIKLFGPSRCMFASDFPVDRLFWGFTELWTAYFQITDEFSEEERLRMFHDNAVAFYRL